MRVISGDRKGFRLQAPPKTIEARPTEDRVKEAVFNVMQPLRKDAVVLDGFACTGQVGIEFLSRGASKCYFSENNRKNVALLKENLEKTRYVEQSKVFDSDFKRNFSMISEPLDYVFLDPPYDAGLLDKAMQLLLEKRLLRDDALVIVETRAESHESSFIGYEKVFDRDYGTANISIYRLASEEEME